MVKNWQGHFSNRILERGFNYYLMDAVSGLVKTSQGYQANVQGTEDYDVSIDLKNGRLQSMSCDCPYAESGNNCKHMAAVLYAIEDRGEDLEKSESPSEIEEIINQMSVEDLREALLSVMRNDNSIESFILTRYNHSITDDQIVSLKQAFENIEKKYLDAYGNLDWYRWKDYRKAVEKFLDASIHQFIQNHLDEEAFDLLCFIFTSVNQQEVYEYSDDLVSLLNDCHEGWTQIYEQASQETKQVMFDWFNEQQVKNSLDNYGQQLIHDFWEEYFQESEYLEEKLSVLDTKISGLFPHENSARRWDLSFQLQESVKQRLILMEQLSYSPETIQSYVKEFWLLSEVRQFVLEKALTEGRVEEAIAILKESKKLDSQYKGLLNHYSEQLMMIYQGLENSRAFKDELISYIFDLRNEDDLVKVNQLKELSRKDEWDGYCQRLLAQTRGAVHFSLLEQKGLFDQLLDEILAISFNRIVYLDKYEKTLKKEFPDLVRDAYVKEISEKIALTSDRKTYRELISYLQKISTYPEGKKISRKMAEDWKFAYPRRLALLDELAKAGF